MLVEGIVLVEGNVEGNEGNVAVGLLGFNLLGIYSVVDDKCRTLLPHPVCINRLVVNHPAPSSHVCFSYASRHVAATSIGGRGVPCRKRSLAMRRRLPPL